MASPSPLRVHLSTPFSHEATTISLDSRDTSNSLKQRISRNLGYEVHAQKLKLKANGVEVDSQQTLMQQLPSQTNVEDLEESSPFIEMELEITDFPSVTEATRNHFCNFQSKISRVLFEVVVTCLGVLFVAACAQISFNLPSMPNVPVTMQTFAVIVLGSLQGKWRAAATCTLYIAAGIAGAPFFADQSGGYQLFIYSRTAGYLVGFIPAAFIAGFVSQKKGWDRHIIKVVAVMITSALTIYVFGVPYLAFFVGWKIALVQGYAVFLLGDLIKVLLASLLLPLYWHVLFKIRRTAWFKRFVNVGVHEAGFRRIPQHETTPLTADSNNN